MDIVVNPPVPGEESFEQFIRVSPVWHHYYCQGHRWISTMASGWLVSRWPSICLSHPVHPPLWLLVTEPPLDGN
jgi:hypothetical protein